ncbi:TolC family protein [Kalamiella sp. sgz302252]|uniref:TolC family protein n=1 Tax=Pantoea sp. sgz302252 TaxID=3341827 RepID=UPI0036D3FF91
MRKVMPAMGLALVLLSGGAAAAGLGPLWQEMQRSSPLLNAGRMGYIATQEAGSQAQAALLPSLSAGTGSSWTEQRLSDQGRQQIGSNGYAVALTMPIVDIAAWKQLDIAHLQETVGAWRWQAQQRQLMVDLAKAWFAQQDAQVEQGVAQHHLQLVAIDLKRALARYQAGEVTRVDVDEVQAAYDLAEADAAEADSRGAQTQDALRQIVGTDPGRVAWLPARLTLPSVRARPLSWWLRQATEHNDAIAMAALEAEVADRRINKIKAEWLPRVDMVASWNHSSHSASDYQYSRGFTSVDGITTAQGAGDSAVIGMQVTVPLYSGGATLSREREAIALSEQARYEWRNEQSKSVTQTRRLYNSLLIGEKRLRALQQAAASSAKASGSVALGYSLGERVSSDLLSARQQQDEVRNRLQQETSKYLINWLSLLQQTGALDARALTSVDALFSDAEAQGYAVEKPLIISFEAYSARATDSPESATVVSLEQ